MRGSWSFWFWSQSRGRKFAIPASSGQDSGFQGAWHEADPGERCSSPRHVLGLGTSGSGAATQRDRSQPLRRELLPIWWGQCALQHVCPLHDLRHPRSASIRPRPTAAADDLRSASFLFGKNVPKTLYTWSPDAIGIEHSWGAGIYLNKGFEFRVTQHFLFDRLGARDTNLGPADLGNNGPWGRYMSLGVRKTFGTRRW